MRSAPCRFTPPPLQIIRVSPNGGRAAGTQEWHKLSLLEMGPTFCRSPAISEVSRSDFLTRKSTPPPQRVACCGQGMGVGLLIHPRIDLGWQPCVPRGLSRHFSGPPPGSASPPRRLIPGQAGAESRGCRARPPHFSAIPKQGDPMAVSTST